MGAKSRRVKRFVARRRRRRRHLVGDGNGDIKAAVAVSVVALAAIFTAGAAASSARHAVPGDAVAVAGASGNAEPGNPDCTLIVPSGPLTARGLATPYRLTAANPAGGPCHEANINQAAFVEGAVLNPRTGQVSIYDPVVVDQGTRPAAAPAVPALPSGAVVALWFGFNGGTLSLAGAGQRQAGCVGGVTAGGRFSSFSEAAACNAPAFFRAASTAIGQGQLRVPPPGTGRDGLPCPTTRSFALVDQDQSDNVTSRYLATSGGRIAQDTAAARKALPGAATLGNGSDNGLLDQYVDPALGCVPWTAPNLADNGAPATALPLDELQAGAYAGRQPRGGPAALVPLSDPMTTGGNGNFSPAKTNAYRSLVDMPSLPAGESPRRYCQDLEQVQGSRLQQDVNLLRPAPSPAAAKADSLFTFLSMRLQQSFGNLGCGRYGLANDVSTTANGGGTVVAACFARRAAPVTSGPGNPAAGLTACPPRRE